MEQDDREDYESTRYEGWEDTYNTLVMRLDPSPTLEKIRHMLLNERYVEETKEWVQIKGLRPRMKKEGVEKIMLELWGRMTVDKVLGNLKEQRINIFVRQLGEVILNFLWHNADQFEIEDAEFESIFYLIVQNVDMFLRRAQNALENIMLNKSMQYKELATKVSRDVGMPGDYGQSPQPSKRFSMNLFGGRK